MECQKHTNMNQEEFDRETCQFKSRFVFFNEQLMSYNS